MKAPAFQLFRLCVYRQIGLVTLEYINPRYIVQNPIVLYNVGLFLGLLGIRFGTARFHSSL